MELTFAFIAADAKKIMRETVGRGLMRNAGLQALLVASVIGLSFRIYLPHVPEPFLDFRAFYCAGAVERAGGDPYREHPLHECERDVAVPGLAPVLNDVTIPAPFPGFVLALFALLAALPFEAALVLWQGAAVAALMAAVLLVARVTGARIGAIAIVLAFPAAIVMLPLGQLTPFVLFAVAGSASLLGSDRPKRAAALALASLLDPHVGIALVLGLFVNVRRTRGTLLAGGLGLLVLEAVVSGPAREWEYLRFVLPAHAVANLTDGGQFSVAHFAFIAGAAPQTAVAIGTLWHGAALLVGIWVARRVRSRLGAAAPAYIPVAFVVFGGTHTHYQQLLIAIPAFVLLSARDECRAAYRDASTFVAAVPWLAFVPLPPLYALPTLLALVFAHEVKRRPLGPRLAAASLIVLIGLLVALSRSFVPRVLFHTTVVGNPLAEAGWQAFTMSRNLPVEAWHVLAQLPTVGAFLILLGSLVRLAWFVAPRRALVALPAEA